MPLVKLEGRLRTNPLFSHSLALPSPSYELQSHTWSLVQPNLDSAYFEPREQHTMAAVRRWLLVAGGCCRQSTGEQKQLADTVAFDTLTNAWDRLNNDGWAAPELGCPPGSGGPCPTTSSSSGGGTQAYAASAARTGGCNGPTTSRRRSVARAPSGDKGSSRTPQLGAGSCAFMGGRLLMLKQTAAGTLGELRTVALSLLDEVARKRAQKRASLIVIEVGQGQGRPQGGRSRRARGRLCLALVVGPSAGALGQCACACRVKGMQLSNGFIRGGWAMWD